MQEIGSETIEKGPLESEICACFPYEYMLFDPFTAVELIYLGFFHYVRGVSL